MVSLSHRFSNTDDQVDGDSSCNSGGDADEEMDIGAGADDRASDLHSSASSSEASSSFHQLVLLPRTRIIVSVVILLAAAAIGATAYVLTARSQNQAFESQYYNFCDLILASMQASSGRLEASVQSFANSITTYAVATGATWPYVTVPDFEIRGLKSNQVSQALSLTFSPLVSSDNITSWDEYTSTHQSWLDIGRAVQSLLSSTAISAGGENTRLLSSLSTDAARIADVDRSVPYAPVWQLAPVPSNASIINYDLLSDPTVLEVYSSVRVSMRPVVSSVMDLDFLYSGRVSTGVYDSTWNPSAGDPSPGQADNKMVTSLIMSPLYPYDVFGETSPQQDELSGLLLTVVEWSRYFTGILPSGVNGIVAVLSNTCGQVFTYEINGSQAVYTGEGDMHDTAYNALLVSSGPVGDAWLSKSNGWASDDSSKKGGACAYEVQLYPSEAFQDSYRDEKPAVYTAVVVLLFFFTAMMFLLYDWLVQRRQDKVNATTKRSNAILSSLFPSNVRDRILKEAEERAEEEEQLRNQAKQRQKRGRFALGNKALLRDFLDEEEEGMEVNQASTDTGAPKLGRSKPIADLFPETTVCMLDLVGFTAWSSVREPTQVFQLLETIYHAFDRIAKRRNVFKVETIGDCYVCVTGLPEPNKDHAISMCRFAFEAMACMNDLTKKLELTLGPDTGELSLRVGLHSGPVTAGVLRGERSRFQLFGDTVITAGLLESTGENNRIHLSQETADLLLTASKGHWIEERKDKINLKGKDELRTYWLTYSGQSSSGRSRSSGSAADDPQTAIDEHDLVLPIRGMANPFDSKTQRLVEWNTDVLSRLLKDVVASRLSRESYRAEGVSNDSVHGLVKQENATVLDEVVEIISLPEFDVQGAGTRVDASNMDLSDPVKQQLRDYITIIASMYRDNPFHNFEHASHVTMSVVKLLSRIVAPNLTEKEIDADGNIASTLHDHTYGITSDPLTQFAVVLSALIHDVDHLGVPNAQLVKENSYLARAYNGKSVAEQNSVDVAWNLLMDYSFRDLRMAIYSNQAEQKRFRQLVVNTVMATDIMDKDLKALRNGRWDKAFKDSSLPESPKDIVDRKATIVIEHLIQASDVAHTMQHWHIFRKWNERLFEEMYKAYKAGRAEKDPSEFWYKGEIGFFDFYIIPLAKKLKDCGVFGVSSDEYLNYAENNRKEWEAKGHDVVAEMVEKYREQNLCTKDKLFSNGEVIDPLDESRDGAQGVGMSSNANDPEDAIAERSGRSTVRDTLETVNESSGDASSADSDDSSCPSFRDGSSANETPDTETNTLDEGDSCTPPSRGALEISDKRFQKQLARVQPPSQLTVSIEQMGFL